MFNISDAIYASKILNISFDKFTIYEFLDGMNVELEHGTINSMTNVTNDDVIITAKIALAHLNEFPNYYNSYYGIKNFENFLKRRMLGE